MRLSNYFVLFFFAGVLASAPNGVSPNPTEQSISHENAARHRSRRLNNGERLAMGLPPLKPKRLYRGDRVSSAPRSEASQSPVVSRTCNILVTDLDSKIPLGYISPGLTRGDYGILQNTQAGALEVTFSYSGSDSSPSKLDLLTTNGPQDSFPYFGGVLHPGRIDYVALSGTVQVQAGPTPQARPYSSAEQAADIPFLTQSAIWAYDPATDGITPHWSTSDSSESENHIGFLDRSMLIVTGDVKQFRPGYAIVSEVIFTCVPSVQDAK